MSFNSDEFAAGLSTFGRNGGMIDLSASDFTVPSTVKAVVACSAGNVVYRARKESSRTITITGISPCQPLPHIPGTIFKAGTTATLCTVEEA